TDCRDASRLVNSLRVSWSYASSPAILASRCQRALVAQRLRSSAQLPSVLAKQQVGLDQPGVVLVESFFDSFLHEAISRGVTFRFFPEPQAQQDTQPVRLQSQNRIGAAE